MYVILTSTSRRSAHVPIRLPEHSERGVDGRNNPRIKSGDGHDEGWNFVHFTET
jgi:hypothetical protein